MEMLIFSRILQGIGAGAVQPIATTIIGDMYTKEERANIQGYLASIWGVSAIMGPILGAVFIEYANWPWVFWMNIPFGILSACIVIMYLHEKVEKKKKTVDYVGAILLFVSLSTFMFVLIQLDEELLLTKLQLIFIIGVSIVSMFSFILHERRTKEPMVTLSLWKKKEIRYANLASFMTGAMLLAVSGYLPTYVQGVLGQSPLIAGLTLTVISIGWPISSTIAGKMMLKTGFRVTAVIGGVALVISSLCFLTLPFIAHFMWAGLGSFLLGVGMGFSTTTFIVSIQSSVEWNVRGEATAMNMFMRLLGGAVGVALLGGILNRQLRSSFEQTGELLSIEPSIDAVNVLLEAKQRSQLSLAEQAQLQTILANSLAAVFMSLFIVAIIGFVFIILLPKDSIQSNKNETKMPK
jgi:MFS family permease